MTQHKPAATRQLTSARVEHGNFETFYLEAGSGQPVLLIHGSGPGVSGRANWQALMASPLATRFRFIAPDVAGFGATRCAEGTELTHDTRVAQLIGFLDAVQLQSVDVIGNSMGGGLALALAHAWPGRVRRMVLMGSMGISFPISEGLEKVWGYTPSIEALEEVLNLFAFNGALITEDLVRMRYEASSAPDVQRRYAQAFPAPRQRHVEAMALPAEALASIQTPTLLVHGRDDLIIPLELTSERLLHLLPNADLVVLGRCGHWTQIERAADFHRYVGGFLAE